MAAQNINGKASVIPFPGLKESVPEVAAASSAPDNSANGWGFLRRWAARAAFRRDLQRLLKANPHLVRDIGLDETLARWEATLPFWQDGQLRPGEIRLPAA